MLQSCFLVTGVPCGGSAGSELTTPAEAARNRNRIAKIQGGIIISAKTIRTAMVIFSCVIED